MCSAMLYIPDLVLEDMQQVRTDYRWCERKSLHYRVGVNLTLMGAELTASYVVGNALHSLPSVGGHATGKNRLKMV